MALQNDDFVFANFMADTRIIFGYMFVAPLKAAPSADDTSMLSTV